MTGRALIPKSFLLEQLKKKINMELTQVHVENGHQNRDGGTSDCGISYCDSYIDIILSPSNFAVCPSVTPSSDDSH